MTGFAIINANRTGATNTYPALTKSTLVEVAMAKQSLPNSLPKNNRTPRGLFLVCSLDGCSRRHKGRGLCDAHLQKQRKYGDPLAGHPRNINQAEFFWSRVDKSAGENACWEWQGATAGGYGRVGWNGKVELSHRVAFVLSGGVLTEDANCVLHSCDNRPCCNPKHLSAGSYAENNQQIYDRDRKSPERPSHRGGLHWHATLTEDDVRKIRQLAEQGISYPEIGRLFGQNRHNIGQIVRRQSWKHLD